MSTQTKQAFYVLVTLAVLVIGLRFDTTWAGWTLKFVILTVGIFMSLPVIQAVTPKVIEIQKAFGRWLIARTLSLWAWVRLRPLLTVGILIGIIAVRICGYVYTQKTWANTTPLQTVCKGVAYQRTVFEGCRMHLLYVDLAKAKPIVMGVENFTYGKMELTKIANDSGVANVLVNGDLFDEGGPQGFFSPGHRMTGPNNERVSLEFKPNYTSEVELLRFSTEAGISVDGDKYPIRHSYNTVYEPGDVGIYTARRGVGSGAGRSKHEFQARVTLSRGREGDARLAGFITEVIENPASNLTPLHGEVVLTAANASWQSKDLGPYAWAKNRWTKGALVKIDLSMTPKPEKDTISGGPEIMRSSKYLVNETKNRWCVRKTARTAVGISEDRQHLLVVVAEGQPKWGDRSLKRCPKLFLRALGIHTLRIFPGFTDVSQGATTQTLYRLFINEGFAHAMNLDGGSSTTLVMRKEGEFRVINTLMEGEEPELATALGFAPR